MNNKLLLTCIVTLAHGAGYVGWDGDGHWIRQLLLIYAGAMGAVVVCMILEGDNK